MSENIVANRLHKHAIPTLYRKSIFDHIKL